MQHLFSCQAFIIPFIGTIVVFLCVEGGGVCVPVGGRASATPKDIAVLQGSSDVFGVPVPQAWDVAS